MAAELQKPESLITTTPAAIQTTTAVMAVTATTTATTTPAQPEDACPLPTASKRQRRPSVRLGEIGDQRAANDSDLRRSKHQPWRFPRDYASKSVKPRAPTNLGNGSDSYDIHEPEDINITNPHNGDANLEFGFRRKAKRPTTKRVISNWVAKVDEFGAEGDSRKDGDDGFRDFEPESDSPVHSVDNVVLDQWGGHRRTGTGRARRFESRENDGMEVDNNLPDSDSRDQNCGGSGEGVRSWLIELGLSRYAPVFEVHEVDDEVLPLLTLEDLKDMGINAVGSRRKLYSAIQKLRKGYS